MHQVTTPITTPFAREFAQIYKEEREFKAKHKN